MGKAPERCQDCHEDPHGGLTDCAKCHTAKGWRPSTFSHPPAGEHIGRGGEHNLACRDCHPKGFASAGCTPCHNGVPQGD